MTTQNSSLPIMPIGGNRRTNRLSLLGISLPVLILVGFCLNGVAQRTVDRSQWGQKAVQSEEIAYTAAKEFCEKLTDSPAAILSMQYQKGYSVRHQKEHGEWNIVCQTEVGKYLLRVNATTGAVYGLNRLDDKAEKTSSHGNATTVLRGDLGSEYATKLMANAAHPKQMGRDKKHQELATKSLALLIRTGIPINQIATTPFRCEHGFSISLEENTVAFSYAWKDKRTVGQFVTITLTEATGSLENYWNPNSIQ
jgi:hypothetical protein